MRTLNELQNPPRVSRPKKSVVGNLLMNEQVSTKHCSLIDMRKDITWKMQNLMKEPYYFEMFIAQFEKLEKRFHEEKKRRLQKNQKKRDELQRTLRTIQEQRPSGMSVIEFKQRKMLQQRQQRELSARKRKIVLALRQHFVQNFR